ncbi:hypothetical protein CLCR_09351 [Cladophialophora carrionii]|uniref:Uncharacterized protein n=1 Tax=Cladophialophora carrionii TaxID=86049 RepID=A0A1C1CUT7_9EURO|nr:hypothetical protein CLCR_09351 [Cladophialophora carrionii]
MKDDIETQQATTVVHPVETIDEKYVDYKDVDAALGFLRNNAASGEVVHIDEKKLMRKVDWMVMPLMFACCESLECLEGFCLPGSVNGGTG